MLISIFVGVRTLMNDEAITLTIVASIILFITLLFYQLSVRVKSNGIQLTYGIGLIQIQLNDLEVESVEVTRTPWYYGLGLRFSPQGMIYNIQSLNAVKINHSKNGKSKTVFIGSPRPEELKKAIEEGLKKKDN